MRKRDDIPVPEIEGQICPTCGDKSSGHVQTLDGREELKVNPGDFAMCERCGAMAVLGDDMRLRLINPEEMRGIQAGPMWPLMQAMQALHRGVSNRWPGQN